MKQICQFIVLILSFSLFSAHSAEDKVSLRLNTQMYGFHSVFYLGLEKGLYKEEGIDLTIGEGQGSGRTVQIVGAKSDTFGISDGASVILGAAAGAPIVAVMGIMNQSPFTIITRADAGIKTLKDLEGKTIAATTGEAGLAIFPAIVKYNKLNGDAIKFLRVDGTSKIVTLLEKRVDAILGGLENQALIVPQRGMAVKTFDYKDIGANTLGLVLHANKDTVDKNPDLVRRFIRATQKSIAFAEKNPDVAVVAALKVKPDLDKDLTLKQIKASLPLVRAATGANQQIGWMAQQDWDLTLTMMKDYRELKTDRTAASFYTNQFLPVK